jgi:protein involved in polysaccharide export with SLBB domain
MKFAHSLRVGAFVFALVLSFFLRNTQGQVSNQYKIAPQDILIIDVVGEKELMREVRVGADGGVSFAWFSDIAVTGKTIAEVEKEIRDLLDKDYIVNPRVLVTVKEYRTRDVSVWGYVNKPGAVQIAAEQPLKIVDAIAKAGGIVSGRGDKNKIFFTRPGKIEKRQYRFDDLNNETDPAKLIFLEPGDVIEVGDKVF